MVLIEEDINTIRGVFINTETGEELLHLNNIGNVSIESDSNYEYSQRYKTHDFTKLNATMTINMNEDINVESILGVDLSRFPDMCDIQFAECIQKRKHKKKRINKKWLKRYGCKMIPVVVKGLKFNTYNNGEIDLVKSSLE